MLPVVASHLPDYTGLGYLALFVCLAGVAGVGALVLLWRSTRADELRRGRLRSLAGWAGWLALGCLLAGLMLAST